MSKNDWALGLGRDAVASLFVFGFFTNLLVLTIPLYMLQVFERVIGGRSVETLLFLTLAATIALITYGVLEAIRGRLLTRLAVGLENRLGGRLLADAIESPGKDAATGIQQLRDLQELRQLLSGGGVIAALDAPWVPLFIVVLFFFHPVFGALAIAGALAMGAIIWASEAATRERIAASNKAAGKTLVLADTYLRNAEALRAMGMSRKATARWQEEDLAMLRGVTAVYDRMGSYGSLAKWIRMLLQILALGSGVYLVINNQLTPGIMIAGSILIARAVAPLELAIGSWRGLVSGQQAYRRLRATLAGLENSTSLRKTGQPTGVVQVDHVTSIVPGLQKPILNNINLTVGAGEMVALTGPSGAGKTTLANLIVGSRLPTLGKVTLDGTEVPSWSQDVLAQHLGYLPQDAQLFAASIADNIARLQDVDQRSVVNAGRRAFSHEMILELPHGYETELEEGGGNLSGGQRRRVALARALFGDPKLVVLDEPDAFLDSTGERALAKALAALKKGKVSTVLITHRPELLAIADRIVCLKSGVIEMSGPAPEILKRLGHEPRVQVGGPQKGARKQGGEANNRTAGQGGRAESVAPAQKRARSVPVAPTPDPAALKRDQEAAAKALLKLGDFIDEQRGSYGEYMVRAYGKNGRQSLNHVRDMFPELLDESLYSIRSEDVARLRDASQEKIRKLDSTPGKAAAKKRMRLGMAALDDCYEHGMRWGLVSRNPAREAGSPGSAVPGVSTLPSAEQR